MTDLEQQLTDHLRERAAAATPHHDLEGVEAGSRPYAPVDLGARRRRHLAPVVLGAAAVVLLVVAVAVALQVQDGDGGTPTTDDDSSTTFVSDRNGFAVRYLPGPEVTATTATEPWDFEDLVDDGFDVLELGSGTVFRGASTPLSVIPDASDIPPDALIDQRVEDFLASEVVVPGGCGVPRDQQAEITIDGEAGTVAECASRIEAAVVSSERLYLFTLTDDGPDRRSVFDALLATVDLRPDDAYDFPGMTTTFVSPINGYSFRYFDRGGLVPATEPWDPSRVRPEDVMTQNDPRFDEIETGLGAYFVAASAPIPDGVPVEEWVDDVHVPNGCGIPQRDQTPITIDGEDGRLTACTGRVEGTVVAGGRLYLFVLAHGRTDAREIFDRWMATVDLRPEAAAP